MYLIDPLRKLAFESQYGKQIIQRLRVRPSAAVTLAEPHFDSAPLPEIPAAAVRMPDIYEQHQAPAVYPGLPECERQEQLALPEMPFTPQFRLESMQEVTAAAPLEPEFSAAAEISHAVELARHPDGLDAILRPPDLPPPVPELGLESLLDDPLLGPLGPLF